MTHHAKLIEINDYILVPVNVEETKLLLKTVNYTDQVGLVSNDKVPKIHKKQHTMRNFLASVNVDRKSVV